MSDLKVFWPDDTPSTGKGRKVDPAAAAIIARVLLRTKRIQQNRRCLCCGGSQITPLERHDAALDRKQQPIAGTASLIGFHCDQCGVEWAVDD